MRDYSNTIQVHLEIGETEYLCEVEFDYYPGDSGKYHGAWDTCYPATDPELIVNSVKTIPAFGNGIKLDLSCLLDNADFLDKVESACWEHQESELDKYAALQEDYEEKRYGSIW